MSHDGSWRAACNVTISIPQLQFESRDEARGVTDPGVGSGALLGGSFICDFGVQLVALGNALEQLVFECEDVWCIVSNESLR
jgi:hypothetical protein